MKKYLPALGITIALCGVLLYILANRATPTPDIHVGWQTAWATQGQLIQAIEHTNIRELNDLRAEFLKFQYGVDLNEAALNHTVEAVNAGVVPLINLISRDSDWVVIARVIDFPISTVVASDSGIARVADLRGKVFGVPIGGGSHPYALQLLRDNHLSYGVGSDEGDVKIRNTPPTEMSIAMSKHAIQAAAVWEPTTTALISQGGAVIDTTRYVGFLAVRRSFADKNKGVIVKLLQTYVDANFFAATHRDDVDRWFSEVSGQSLDLVKRTKVIERNFSAKHPEEIDIDVKFADIALMQQVAEQMFRSRPALLAKELNVGAQVDMSFLTAARDELRKNGYLGSRVRIEGKQQQ